MKSLLILLVSFLLNAPIQNNKTIGPIAVLDGEGPRVQMAIGTYNGKEVLFVCEHPLYINLDTYYKREIKYKQPAILTITFDDFSTYKLDFVELCASDFNHIYFVEWREIHYDMFVRCYELTEEFKKALQNKKAKIIDVSGLYVKSHIHKKNQSKLRRILYNGLSNRREFYYNYSGEFLVNEYNANGNMDKKK